MSNLLFELGCEEMPASAVDRASHELLNLLTGQLTEAGISYQNPRVFGTPRRIIIALDSLPDRQSNREEEQRGPRAQAAFDSDGNPTKALEGFCRGQGITPGQVFTKDDYVWFSKKIEGQTTKQLLATILPESLKALKFDKTMRWGLQKARFVRPIRWILATLDNDLIEFELFNVNSGLTSRGHRFMAPGAFTPSSWDNHLALLREHFVEPDPAERRKRIVAEAKSIASGIPDLPEALVDENTHLTEWPIAHEGTFSAEFLDLPDPVLITAMAKHQRFFPVRDSSGTVQNKFIAIRNNGNETEVKAGNEWVLNARFNDARFFYQEDQKRSLDEFLADTEQMLFQDKLGTVRSRADRLALLTVAVNRALGSTNDSDASKAGLYAKADLSTGLVSELSSLQGVIGGEYALREGLPAPVAQAIGNQYALPDSLSDENCLGVALLVADQIDKLAGFLGLGLIPTGSSDPFGLRRAASFLIQAGWLNASQPLNFQPLFAAALEGYKGQSIQLDTISAERALTELFANRYEAMLSEIDYDVHNAAASPAEWGHISCPDDYRKRANVLAEYKSSPEAVQTFTRPLNILAAARSKGDAISESCDEALLNDQGRQLYQVLGEPIANLQAPIHDFFESTMVMDPDPSTRANNLGLLQKVESVLNAQAGDFTKLVIE